jgi:hypothetical protein
MYMAWGWTLMKKRWKPKHGLCFRHPALILVTPKEKMLSKFIWSPAGAQKYHAITAFLLPPPHHIQRVQAEPFLVGRHEPGLQIVYVSGDPANKGFSIWYKVVAPAGKPVTDSEQLDKSFTTRCHKDILQFAYTDRMKLIVMA